MMARERRPQPHTRSHNSDVRTYIYTDCKTYNMSFASVSSPAPARGGPGVPAAPSRAVGGLPSVAALSNPNIRAASPGTQINMSVNVGLMCRPWSSNWQNKYKEGDILFVHIGDDHVSQTLRRVANLPVLNEILRRPDETLADWRFFGVLVSVMDAGNQQRLFGVTVQGRASVINYWHGKLTPTDRLFLGLYEANEGTNINGGEIPIAEGETVNRVFARKENDLAGAAGKLYIGFVGIRPNRSNVPNNQLDKAAQVQDLSSQLKRIEIFLRR